MLTDSRSYLNFGSSHPRHTFSGIVYSGCFISRRIINNQERLESRLNELKACFKNDGYPDSLIDNTIRKAHSDNVSLAKKCKNAEKQYGCKGKFQRQFCNLLKNLGLNNRTFDNQSHNLTHGHRGPKILRAIIP
jgi:hypothetical protein